MSKSQKEFRIAVAGLGHRIATVLRHVLAAAPSMKIAGYADPAPAGLTSLEQHGIEAGAPFESVEALIAGTKPDLLMVGSPNHLHLAHIKAGLEAGVRVFTEKPVVRTAEETFELAELLRDHGEASVLVGLVLRSSPLVREVRRYFDEGKLGALISFEGNEHLHPEHGGFLMRDWRRDSAHGGSYLLDKCCHDFDLYRLFAGALPARIASFGGRRIFTPEHEALKQEKYPGGEAAYSLWPGGWNGENEVFRSKGDAVDHQTALIHYENGVQLAFHTNTHAGILQRRWYFAGTKGALEADLVTNTLTYSEAFGRRPREEQTVGGNLHEHYGSDPQMGRDLAAHLLEGAPFPVQVYDAMVAGLTVMAADEAMRESKIVDCAPLWQRLHAALGRA